MAKGGLTGLSGAKLALLDDNGAIIKGSMGIGDATGVYTVTAQNDLGMASANLTGLAPTLTAIYGNNVKTDVSVGKAQPSVALVINALDVDTKYRVLGYTKDTTTGGYTPTGKASKVALLLQTNLLNGDSVYFGFQNGTLVEGGGVNMATDTQNETRQTDQMTYSPNATDKMPVGYKVYVSSATGFSESAMMAEVFGATAPASQAS